MTDDRRPIDRPDDACLTDEDFYFYVSNQDHRERLGPIEKHLVRCAHCRQNLAGLLEILSPDTGQPLMDGSEPSAAEISRTLDTIQTVSKEELARGRQSVYSLRWPLAAAAAVLLVALGSWGFINIYERYRAEAFYFQAKSLLEQDYTGTSPGNLRLALPFHSSSVVRGNAPSDSLHQAENVFFQAIAVRENMVGAHLGLAYIYISESKPSRARDEFQRVLDFQKNNIYALIGRGVARYEDAVQVDDPTQRNTLLMGALGDFDEALKVAPDSLEACYNRVWALFESGRYKEALQGIERYLSVDSSSVWAERLRGLKTRMRAAQTGAMDEDIRRLALRRDEAALLELAREIPFRMPEAILSVVKQSLDSTKARVKPGSPSSEDLRWAARTMESAYSNATGDHGFEAFLVFCDGLSPPERQHKSLLDKKFRTLDDFYRDGKFDVVLRESQSLEREYTILKDSWQLTDLYHLRGNSFYLGNADFDAAETEFRKMLESADRLGSLSFMAKAIGSLAMIRGMQSKFDESLRDANQLKQLAQAHNLESWQVYACIMLGNQYRRMGQFEMSLREYATALKMSYRMPNGMDIIETLEKLGILMDRLGRIQDAKAFYRLALQKQKSLLESGMIRPMPEVTIRRLNMLFREGELAMRTGDSASAETLFLESLNATPPGMRELEDRDRIGLAEIYLETNRIGEAENMLDSATASGTSGPYPEIQWQARTIKGRLLERIGNRREALLSFQEAIGILEQLRRNIGPEDLRRSFLIDRYDPFRRAVSLLFKKSGDNSEALDLVERAKSITLKEHLKYGDPSASLPKSSMVEHPKSGYSIIEYFFTNDALLIFLTSQGSREAVSQDIRPENISRKIQKYLASIQTDDSDTFTESARWLYDELILPIERHAFENASQTLVILPDGPLHLLPFAGLQDSQGRFLIEKAPLAFAPSRRVFHHCIASGNEKNTRNLSAVLIDGSANLPRAREELSHLSALFGRNALVLTPGDLPVFRRAVADSEILHFSGHSIDVQSKPVLVLQTSPQARYLDCPSINTWKMRHSYLVNLAGCSTGIGPLSEGEAPWGLIPAFLNAGAPAIIASLMPVDDASTSRLNGLFYGLLQKGVNKARALQRAQLALLNSTRSGPNVTPRAWTPYVLIGNPQ
jgi:CHAT domain-containing protein